MLRVFIALNIFFLSLLACNGDNNSCELKTKNLKVIQNDALIIPLKNNQTLIYALKQPNAKVLKHDPFLNLYLVQTKRKIKFPFRINTKRSKVKLKTQQIGLNTLASYAKPVRVPSLLLSSCCNLEGLVTPQGVIQREYLDNFIHSKNSYYGDLGVRVVDKGKLIIINRVDPFDTAMQFKKGDCITHLNGKKVLSASKFMMAVLFSKLGTKFKVRIVRDSKEMVVKTKVKQRFGGGAISDTFLEQNGLYFSDNLTVIGIGDKFNIYGLDLGDRLMQVNGKKVKTIADIRKNIDDFKHFASLLFTRNNFQFFVNINP